MRLTVWVGGSTSLASTVMVLPLGYEDSDREVLPAGRYSPTDNPDNVALTVKGSTDAAAPNSVIDVDNLRLELRKVTVGGDSTPSTSV